MSLAYLACPYSDPNPEIREERHQKVNFATYLLLSRGIHVYSPLTHNIPINNMGIFGNWLTWKNFDHTMLSKCDRVIVLKLPGWEHSNGVTAEMQYAKELGLPIEWMEFPEADYQAHLAQSLACQI